MATIEAQLSSVRDAFVQAANAAKPAPARAPASNDAPSKNDAGADRTVHDTVTLSEGGEKIVNLSRGQDLAQQLKEAPVDKAFTDNLKQGTDDVFRITRLFSETIKSAFSWLR